ncbi:hypothetical protein SERLA73DRAFT_185209 [Serpula lacrymans var. lacrymans S7.3]|uniref:Uncharacterized protein n=2 Tax=Serpula lacrymans var. lacrymans TaxID=341189 RepID=F8Q497_SERL3|nr:uncharacterized protein SERLADRAFT_473529 [Serpula lacrymans var. lacrymans S7.9]EGN96952.1 hypothetical protein SERLA73DRAFT_185209 [Serpula lacrymans var. lacrymans S7.3]EGO22547.1 hypothetical protein SERLADRAFT_473529 [Serpula lacrymans var. lacrymans S7.9]
MASPSVALSQTRTRILDFAKPHKSEAAVRLRTSTAGIAILLLVMNLSPLPSLWTCFGVVLSQNSSATSWWFYLCSAELALLSLFALNVLQAGYALKYPRAPLPPLQSPAKANYISPVSQKKRLRTFTPNTSPQLQKSFSSSYISSPISTPSRTLHYTMPSSPSPFNTPLNSSSISIPPSPSPVIASPLAAYRGRHSASVGHAFDGSILSRLNHDSEDDEDE